MWTGMRGDLQAAAICSRTIGILVATERELAGCQASLRRLTSLWFDSRFGDSMFGHTNSRAVEKVRNRFSAARHVFSTGRRL
jgi:hypothetical protein